MTTAIVDWALDVTCPKCLQNNNLADGRHDTEGEIASHIFNNRWEQLQGLEVECQWCNRKFKLDNVEV